MRRLITTLLEQPKVYRLWQAPFVRPKLAPFLRHNARTAIRRVLDVGCGPGTNAPQFVGADYLGVDINPSYIAYARRRFVGRFEVADAAQLNMAGRGKFDCILVNSLLHHLDDSQVKALIGALRKCAAEDGAIHILELVRPAGRGMDALLARADRGHYSRSGAEWQELVDEVFELVVVEPYSLRLGGVVLWNMIYLKGRPR